MKKKKMREGHVVNASRPTTRVDPANNKVRLIIDIKILNDFAKRLLCLLVEAIRTARMA